MDSHDIRNLQEAYLNVYSLEEEDSKYDPTLKSYNIYDLVLTHLLDEGYVNDLESAENIMENMSEKWVYDILEAKWGKQPLPAEKMLRKAGRHDYYAGWLRGEYEGNSYNRFKKKKRTQEMEDESKGRANKIRNVVLQRMSER